MEDEAKGAEKKECGCRGGGRCGGCKFLAGILVGLLLAGTGLGLFMAGHCAAGRCAMRSSMPPPASPPAR
jgi:hypothetical protein